ncbi:hypothetical protein BCR34DRAFT_596426 [Clohesyomyces aquaticus]|uniref:Uncharacterized protein n=1 Tax=Clohesyomyces aquaticus TaxID=1231657 RepID=A0A1Y2A826_9PLEO|nr:hypothetical protein BCR34DRAFT_596426 [Clohesyomyces aquaticus]
MSTTEAETPLERTSRREAIYATNQQHAEETCQLIQAAREQMGKYEEVYRRWGIQHWRLGEHLRPRVLDSVDARDFAEESNQRGQSEVVRYDSSLPTRLRFTITFSTTERDTPPSETPPPKSTCATV